MTRAFRLILLLLIVASQHAGLAALLADDSCCGEKSQACDDDCSTSSCALRSCCAERTFATPPGESPREAAVQRTRADLPEAEKLHPAELAEILHVPKALLA